MTAGILDIVLSFPVGDYNYPPTKMVAPSMATSLV